MVGPRYCQQNARNKLHLQHYVVKVNCIILSMTETWSHGVIKLWFIRSTAQILCSTEWVHLTVELLLL